MEEALYKKYILSLLLFKKMQNSQQVLSRIVGRRSTQSQHVYILSAHALGFRFESNLHNRYWSCDVSFCHWCANQRSIGCWNKTCEKFLWKWLAHLHHNVNVCKHEVSLLFCQVHCCGRFSERSSSLEWSFRKSLLFTIFWLIVVFYFKVILMWNC